MPGMFPEQSALRVDGYCQIYCQIRGFEGVAGDKSCCAFSNLLIRQVQPPSSNPSLSATLIL